MPPRSVRLTVIEFLLEELIKLALGQGPPLNDPRPRDSSGVFGPSHTPLHTPARSLSQLSRVNSSATPEPTFRLEGFAP